LPAKKTRLRAKIKKNNARERKRKIMEEATLLKIKFLMHIMNQIEELLNVDGRR
jgi:hypothetical protein